MYDFHPLSGDIYFNIIANILNQSFYFISVLGISTKLGKAVLNRYHVWLTVLIKLAISTVFVAAKGKLPEMLGK